VSRLIPSAIDIIVIFVYFGTEVIAQTWGKKLHKFSVSGSSHYPPYRPLPTKIQGGFTMKKQPAPIQGRQFLESILKHEVHADEMQKYENMAKANDLARVADILEKGAVNRRDFLKSGRLAALLGGVAAVSNNCAGGSLMLGGVKETGPVHYPRLPGYKIQSPEHYGLEGCMVGYYSNPKFL